MFFIYFNTYKIIIIISYKDGTIISSDFNNNYS